MILYVYINISGPLFQDAYNLCFENGTMPTAAHKDVKRIRGREIVKRLQSFWIHQRICSEISQFR